MDFTELKKKLSPTQFEVMCNEGTEPPFQNEYWDNKKDGIYVDRISGVVLFSSLDKYDSGTGWPSFTKPLSESSLILNEDLSQGMKRIEVKSKTSNAHLGHVFDDGPAPGHKRFCINSASLLFIPVEDLEKKGYGKFKSLFQKQSVPKTQKVVLGGGCFWGVEQLFRGLTGVLKTDVGYAGGDKKNPTYEDVKGGKTRHAEVVEIEYAPDIVSYAEILDFFFKIHDPTTKNQQGEDRGDQYRSVIFLSEAWMKPEAEKAIKRAQSSGRWKDNIVTELVEGDFRFWKAEEYHQDYLVKHPSGYTCHFVRD